MEELDPESREALRRYQGPALAAPAHARVLERLDASMRAAETQHEQQTSIRPRRTTFVVLTALAAALLLSLCDLRARLGDASRRDDNIAPYTAPPAPDTPAELHRPAPAPPSAPALEPAPAPRRKPSPDLAAELAHLQRARAAIDAHAPDAALDHLAEHAREFPDGQMRQDRQLLRVEALCARGDAAQARLETAAFLRKFPGSPHTDKIQQFCPTP